MLDPLLLLLAWVEDPPPTTAVDAVAVVHAGEGCGADMGADNATVGLSPKPRLGVHGTDPDATVVIGVPRPATALLRLRLLRVRCLPAPLLLPLLPLRFRAPRLNTTSLSPLSAATTGLLAASSSWVAVSLAAVVAAPLPVPAAVAELREPRRPFRTLKEMTGLLGDGTMKPGVAAGTGVSPLSAPAPASLTAASLTAVSFGASPDEERRLGVQPRAPG